MLGISKRINFRRRFYSQYEGRFDEFGFDAKIVARMQPLFQFLFEGYFDVRVIGLENIPSQGRAILIGNHSGVIPMDAFMLLMAVLLSHSAPRRIRYLAHHFLLEYKPTRKLLCGLGAVPAKLGVAEKLLENDELVFLYPEGARGTGKKFSMRYRLCDFDPGFVKAAITMNAPIIPIVTVGADEIYPLLGNMEPVARVMDAPYWPVTPTYPWFPFITSCIPLPIKFLIKIGKPVYLECSGDFADRRSRLELAKSFQYNIQRQLNLLLSKRKSPFVGWDERVLAELESEESGDSADYPFR
jgi:1-acyl-sn-glycerol-3-phosphate acyltransferase